ncbi:MAG: phosphopantetheine-binding protein [Betaproteobacteria bacterium]
MSSLPVIQQMLIEEFGLSNEQVQPEALLEEMGIDSLATIEFMFLLEDKFKLELSSEPKVVKTVADIVREVDELIAQQAKGIAAQ